jgi:O-antigen/teichoic acid export membrane protein
MNDSLDERLGRMLREDAPAERDALFRISLIEHRERRRYESRRRVLFTSAVAAALLFVVLMTLWRNLPRGGLLSTALVAVFATALIVASVVSIRGARQALRWMRGS